MNRDLLIDFISNAAFLLVLAALYDILSQHTKVPIHRRKVIAGFVLGLVCVAIMTTFVQFQTGIIFDTRSILLSIVGLFFGTVPAVITAVIAILYRLYLGGSGALTGVLVIIVSGGMGVLWRHLRRRWFTQFTWQELYGFGLVVHVAMLICLLTLPSPIKLEVLRIVAIPVLIVYPLTTMLLGLLLAYQQERRQIEDHLYYQASILKNVSDAVISTDMDFRIQAFNHAAENLYGWQANEAVGQLMNDLIPTEYLDETREAVIEQFLTEGSWQGEVRQPYRNGEKLVIMSSVTLLYDDFGSAVGSIAVNRDMTQYKQMEKRNQLLLQLTTAVTEAPDLDTAWQTTLKEICDAADWHMGEIWALSADHRHLVLETPYYCREPQLEAFRQFSNGIQFKHDDGLPGKVWADKKAHWLSDIGDKALFVRVEAARETGLQGSIAIPVLDRNEVIAVMNFLLMRNPTREDEQMIEIISVVAAQLGTAVKRKQVEDRLHLKSAALNAAANAIALLDNNGIIQWANPAFSELTGYSEEEIIGNILRHLVPSDLHDPGFIQEVWDTIRAGGVWHGEILNRRKDGSYYTEVETITPVSDETGEITHYIVIKQDITARKEIEADRVRLTARMQEQARHIQQIIDTIPTGVLEVDIYGRVHSMNPVAQNYLETLTLFDEYETILYLGDKALEELLKPLPVGQRHEVTSHNRIFEVVSRPIDDGDDIQAERWVLLINEVTDERANQRYQQTQDQLALVGQLAAGIAHDFNNIMGVIMIYAQMLQELPDLPKDSYRRLATINAQAQHATALIGQILDFSRRSIMEMTELDLLPFVKELIKLLERTLPENIRIELIYNENHYPIAADPTRIQQALMNLAVNARDAMPQGGELHFEMGVISVAQGEVPPLPDMESGSWVRLDVRDTGEGITPENISHLFEPFFSTKTPDRGTGLGLAQVYGIVKQHGGSIDVQSKPGEGTTFTLYLPLLDIPEVAAQQSAALPTVLPIGMETILLVEDDLMMRFSINQALTRLGYKTLVAADGMEALEILAKNGRIIDLVLSDMIMPNLDGISLYQIMCNEYPETLFLLMSGHAKDERKEEYLQTEAVHWLAKPFDMTTLAIELRAVFDRT